MPWRSESQEEVRGCADKQKAARLRGKQIILLTTLAGLWSALFGLFWKSSGEILAAGVEDANAVPRDIPGFQKLPGGNPRWLS